MHGLIGDSLCGLCASASPFDKSTLVDINGNFGKDLNLKEMLAQYIPFDILQNLYSGPHCICSSCLKNLEHWHKFLTGCKEAQRKLKEEWKKAEKQVDANTSVICPARSSSEPLIIIPRNSPEKIKKSCNYCVARWCNNGNYRGVSLFRIPKEKNRAMVWLTAADRTDLKHSKSLHNHYLCASHFTSNMFTNKSRNQLIKKAVPTIFPKPHYAHKVIGNEAMQITPTRLFGVPLKTILPKDEENHHRFRIIGKIDQTVSSDSHSSSTSLSLNAAKWKTSPSKEKSSDFSGSNFILEVISPDVSTAMKPGNEIVDSCISGNVTSTVQSASGSRAMSHASDTECQTHVRSGSSYRVEGVWLKNSDAQEVLKTPLSNSEDGSGPGPTGLQIPQNTEPSQEISGSDEMSRRAGLIQKSSHSHPSYSTGKSEIFEEGCDFFSNSGIYSTTAGSQDLLLTHLIDKVEKNVSNFQVQNLTLNCDLSQDSPQTTEKGPIQNSELNTTNSLFDLQTDDVRDSAVYIQQMENLDELMDLDNFFESR